MAIAQELSTARAGLTALQSRLTTGTTDLSNDPTDPDLQILAGLKEKLSSAEAEVGPPRAPSAPTIRRWWPNRRISPSSQADCRRDRENARASERAHRDAASPDHRARGRARSRAEGADRGSRPARPLAQLQRNVDFLVEQLNAREKVAEQAKLKSKLTFSDMTVLDKAAPPVEPAFPKPFIVVPVGIAAGLALGLILALLAEAADRRVRFPIDLEYSASAPFLGALDGARRSRSRIGASRRSLRPA